MPTRILSVVLLIGLLFVQTAFAGYELDRAKEAMNRGDFRRAIDQYRTIAGSYSSSEYDRREAMYFTGFCFVKLSDPWSAITAYEAFLSRYENSSDRALVPDALYVLGRTYEDVGRASQAEPLYRRCISRFPGSEFARKCEDRLRVIGHGGSPNYPGGLTQQVADMIELSKMAGTSYEADEILKKAARRARSGADFVAISRAVRNEYTRSEISSILQGSDVLRAMTTYEAVDFARTISNSYTRDEFLLASARKNARTMADFRLLMDATTNSYTRSQILEIANKVISSGRNVDLQIVASVEAAPEAPAKAGTSVAAASDPFAGFSPDHKRIRRVNWFVESVAAKKNMGEMARQLSREDMSLDVVKQSLKEYSTMKKFDDLHKQDR
ncbi:MAG TPA: tetratricopeptide repeat protein [Candidatus Ozemobacteraceae bacterium]|nr:tetratricopeptide repeat protein [Candidatus Ozemobacteraceae bacterium]